MEAPDGDDSSGSGDSSDDIPEVTVPMMTVPDRRIMEMILPVTVIQGIIMMKFQR